MLDTSDNLENMIPSGEDGPRPRQTCPHGAFFQAAQLTLEYLHHSAHNNMMEMTVLTVQMQEVNDALTPQQLATLQGIMDITEKLLENERRDHSGVEKL